MDRKPGPEGPPDLDKIIRDWQRKWSGLFGGSKRGSGSGGDADGGLPLLGVLVLVLIGWAATGFYMVDAAERGIVQRFGAYVRSTDPGLRWHLPWPIETVDKVNVSNFDKFNQSASMLTADENIVDIDTTVQYIRAEPISYLFDVELPDETLADASESAIREVVGQNDVKFIFENLAEIADQTQIVIQEALDEYSAGIIVQQVALEKANYPQQVTAAVDDATKAREDKVRLEFEAESYRNDILPKARGAAARQLQNAQAYRDRVVADSEGEAARFTALLSEYQKAPRVTRERLYIDAVEEVFGNSSKVLLDAEGSGNLLYLPVDKLIEQSGKSKQRTQSSETAPSQSMAAPNRQPAGRDVSRERGSRQ